MARNLKDSVPTVLMVFFAAACRPSAPSAQTQSLVDGNTAFAVDLYGQLKTTPGNLLFSPYSLSTVLAMTWAGARGDNEKQMGRVLHLRQDQRQLHSSFGELQRQLSEADKEKGIE